MKYFIMIVMIGLLSSCGDEEAETKNDQESEEVSVASCDCDELMESDQKMHYQNKKFTGTCYSFYPGTQDRYETIQYKNGVIENAKYYAKDGSVLTNTDYVDGKEVRNTSWCKCGELESVPGFGFDIFQLDGKNFTGICRAYYPESKDIYREERYENGLKNGLHTIYDKQGNPLSRYNYKNGFKFGAQMKYDNSGNIIEYEEYDKNGEIETRFLN